MHKLSGMIDTVLFDMDGLLLDTEPLWGESMLRIAQKHGVPITREQFKETTGLRIYEVTDYWAIKYPWNGVSSIELADEILDDIIALSKQKGSVMPGVLDTINMLKQKGCKLGLASSSPRRMIDELIHHFDLVQYFDVVTSADVVDYGKPHPGVFLHAAQELNSNPLNCLVLEDSVNGMLAAKSARMSVIMVPDPMHFDKPEFVLADAKLSSLEDFDIAMLESMA